MKYRELFFNQNEQCSKCRINFTTKIKKYRKESIGMFNADFIV